MKQCNNLYSPYNILPKQYVCILENSKEYAFLRLNIFTQNGETEISNFGVTIYVTDGMQRDIPIMYLISTLNPLRIELPVLYELGTQIQGPEYNFSTYNIRVEAFGYFANIIYNIRLFSNTTTDFYIEMIPISEIRREPIIEERIDIPPHPRDITIN
ncbi:hypothetical protein [Sedimentibacter sp.]|nr:hypothetical protein [Sedimentibacter sp.]